MRLRIVLMLLSALTVLVVTASAWLYERQQTLQALKRQAAESLSLKSSNVIAEIERFRYLPFVLGQDERIQRLLDDRGRSGTRGRRQRYLETVNGSAGSIDLFVLDANGTILASSNWQDRKNSFVGKLYAFRPYFMDAISCGRGPLLRRRRHQRHTRLFPGAPYRDRRRTHRRRCRESRHVGAREDLDIAGRARRLWSTVRA